ncbi:NAD(P)/FAD-dependent oxidoreductase [Nocardia sp. NPDC055321]
MSDPFEAIVIGGGIAGLMTAVRLSHAGLRTALVERDALGAGATTGNHGIIHSGALYARHHPHVAALCAEAQHAFHESFPARIVEPRECRYVGTEATLSEYQRLWREHGFTTSTVDPDESAALLASMPQRDFHVAAVRELVIDTRSMLTDLAADALAHGATLFTGAHARRVVTERGRVIGVETADGFIAGSSVIVCGGIGTHELLTNSRSVVADELRSRLEVLMAFRGEVAGPVIGLEFGLPALAPAAVGGTVLASRYGAPQQFITGRGRWPVPLAYAAELTREVLDLLGEDTIDPHSGLAWVCSKTEHAGKSSDSWGTQPNYSVIDHDAHDGVKGWWTVLPGKMTLALHASRDAAAAITGRPQPLPLPVPAHSPFTDPDTINVTRAPWATDTEEVIR